MSHRAIDTLALLAGLTLFGCTDSSTNDGTTGVVDENLAAFDQLDFDAYNKQDWDLFRHLHCSDVVVTNYDGSQTQGIDAHVAFLNEEGPLLARTTANTTQALSTFRIP